MSSSSSSYSPLLSTTQISNIIKKKEMVKETELIFIPVPATGHLLVHIELAKRLISSDNRIKTITILQINSPAFPHASTFARSLVASHPKIHIHELPSLNDNPPLDLLQKAFESFIIQLIKKATPFIKEAISTIIASRLQDSVPVRVSGLVIDFFCNSLIKDVGNELNIPTYIFLTNSARCLSVMKYIPYRHGEEEVASELELDWNSADEELTIPGFINSIPTKFMPPGLFLREAYEAYVDMGPRFSHAKGILVNSFAELEPHTFEYFSQLENYPPVYPVGPILSLEDRASPDKEASDRIVTWLGEQPESSVVFLCFGSKGTIDEPQVKEIARALEVVGCRFLWSIHTSDVKTNPDHLLPDGFMSRVMGRVCGWAPQVEVLAHKAIRGFVSHCGWNSTLESLWFGVPVATWPMYAEQQLNAFTLVKELELAVDLRMDYVLGRGGLVTCDEIVRAVRSLMDDGDEKRKKVKEMADAAKKAVMDGGSSSLATARFIGELLEDDGSC